jgi:hypothetical protein
MDADYISFQFYNDFFAGTDQHFTHGVALSWLDDTYEHNSSSRYSKLMIDAFKAVSSNGLDNSKCYNAGLSLSQSIMTPKDVTISTPQYNEIPYVGYLAISLYLFERDYDSFSEYRIDFGVIGEESGSKQTQNTFHSIIGNSYAKGWDTQIGTEYTVNTLFRNGYVSWKSKTQSGLKMDWFNHYGFELGNFETNIFSGTMFRIGDNYIQNFNVHYPYLREEAGLLEIDKKRDSFGWSLSAGINGKIIAYSGVIDEAKNDGYDLSLRTINGSLYVGAELYYEVHKISYSYQSQSPYTYQQGSADTYGSLMYAYKF